MQSVLRLAVPLLITGTAFLALHAQQSPKKPTADRSLRIAFVAPYIPPVSGIPVSAEYAIETERPPAAGESETWHSITQVARDHNGRIRHELRDAVPASFTKEPPLLGVVLLDPVARLSHNLDPVLQTDDRQWFHVPHLSRFDPGAPGGEDLGTKTIDGLEVRGERRTWTLPPRLGAPGQSVHVMGETWYSVELQLVVLERRTDSSGGVVTIRLSHFDRSEPPAPLFKVPPGYHPLAQRNVVSGNRGPLTPPGVPGGTIPGADSDPIANNGGHP